MTPTKYVAPGYLASLTGAAVAIFTVRDLGASVAIMIGSLSGIFAATLTASLLNWGEDRP